MNIYNTVPAAHIKRSKFHWKKERYQTQDFGAIVPMFWRECLPGDIWKIKQSNFIRTMPLVAPCLTPIRYYSEFWFFPTRCLMQKYYPEVVDAWATFIFGGPNGDGKNEAGQTPTLPIWIPNKSNVRLAGTNVVNGVQFHKTGNADAKGSLWDYFGLPVNQGYHDLDNNGEKTVGGQVQSFLDYCPLMFAKIAYNWLWNEFKRNENVESSVALDSDDVQFCKWKKDRYTSSLPFQQRGGDVGIPVSGLGSITFSNDLSLVSDVDGLKIDPITTGLTLKDYPSVQTLLGSLRSPSQGDPNGVNNTSFYPGPGPDQGSTYSDRVLVNGLVNGTIKKELLNSTVPRIDESRAIAGNISDLRLAIQTQKFLERAARGGVRYIEGLKSFFGTSPSTDVLNLPHFIGGMKQNIIVNEVLQTSQTTQGVDGSPQGNMAGRGISAAGENIGVLSCKEHGYILGICWIKPDLYYSAQGMKKEWIRRSRWDYYWPMFAHLSEQPIMRSELFASPATMTPDQMGKGSAGLGMYTGIYNEYRSSENEICGDMRDTFKYWHLAREFFVPPELNSDFITCFPRKDIFAVQNVDEFIVDSLLDIEVYRPMPVEAVPGLMDHF